MLLTSDPWSSTCSFIGLISDSILHIQTSYELFPWYLVPPVNCIICFDFDTLLSNSHPLLWLMVVWIHKIIPMGCIYASAICENPETSTSHTLLVLHQINFQHFNFIENEKRMKGYASKK